MRKRHPTENKAAHSHSALHNISWHPSMTPQPHFPFPPPPFSLPKVPPLILLHSHPSPIPPNIKKKMANLDHIIILLPHHHILHPPPWLTDSFTISPGGIHSDGKTENRLICFRDGSYLEIIAFI